MFIYVVIFSYFVVITYWGCAKEHELTLNIMFFLFRIPRTVDNMLKKIGQFMQYVCHIDDIFNLRKRIETH